MASVDDYVDREPLCVVVNDEELWSIWPVGKPLPPGWRPAGVSGSEAECLSHIQLHWVDMRPLSVRRHFA